MRGFKDIKVQKQSKTNVFYMILHTLTMEVDRL